MARMLRGARVTNSSRNDLNDKSVSQVGTAARSILFSAVALAFCGSLAWAQSAFNVTGSWTDNVGSKITLTQDASGNITGTADYSSIGCPVWPVTGSFRGSQLILNSIDPATTYVGSVPTIILIFTSQPPPVVDVCLPSTELTLTLASDGNHAAGFNTAVNRPETVLECGPPCTLDVTVEEHSVGTVVTLSRTQQLPDAIGGQAYSTTFAVAGSPPFPLPGPASLLSGR
jgi:hypothetical protein